MMSRSTADSPITEVRRRDKWGAGTVLGAVLLSMFVIGVGLPITLLLSWLTLSGSFSLPMGKDRAQTLLVLLAFGPAQLWFWLWGLRNLLRMRPGARVAEISEAGLTVLETPTGRRLERPDRVAWNEIDALRLDCLPYGARSLYIVGRDRRKRRLPVHEIDPDRARVVDEILTTASKHGIGIEQRFRYLGLINRTTWHFHMPGS